MKLFQRFQGWIPKQIPLQSSPMGRSSPHSQPFMTPQLPLHSFGDWAQATQLLDHCGSRASTAQHVARICCKYHEQGANSALSALYQLKRVCGSEWARLSMCAYHMAGVCVCSGTWVGALTIRRRVCSAERVRCFFLDCWCVCVPCRVGCVCSARPWSSKRGSAFLFAAACELLNGHDWERAVGRVRNTKTTSTTPSSAALWP